MTVIKGDRKLALLIYWLTDPAFQFGYQIPSSLTGKNVANFRKYESDLLTLEPDDDIVKEFKDEVKLRKGTFLTEAAP